MDRREKLVAAARRAAVMTDLQNIRAQLCVTGEQPVLFPALSITNKQKAHHSVSHQRNRAGEVWILQSDGPDGVRSQEGNGDTVDLDGIAGMHAVPVDSVFAGDSERTDVSLGAASEGGIPVATRMHRAQNTGGAAYMIVVRMGKHE